MNAVARFDGGMPSLDSVIANLAQSPLTPVLVEGPDAPEVARRIHDATYALKQAPFVAVDCTWLPPNDMGRLLFGFENPPRVLERGLVEQANGGTLFLEDIADLPNPEQALLAKFLDGMRFRRIRGVRDLEVSLRLVASVRSGISTALENGRLRRDLHARLSVFPIVVP